MPGRETRDWEHKDPLLTESIRGRHFCRLFGILRCRTGFFASFLERDSFSSGHQNGLGYSKRSVGVEGINPFQLMKLFDWAGSNHVTQVSCGMPAEVGQYVSAAVRLFSDQPDCFMHSQVDVY